ncbi:hypothetical protein QTP88_000339 [Uroleucon formosanum]
MTQTLIGCEPLWPSSTKAWITSLWPMMLDILCRPIFEELLVDHLERGLVLEKVEETFRILKKMAKKIITLNENKEKERQAKKVAVD